MRKILSLQNKMRFFAVICMVCCLFAAIATPAHANEAEIRVNPETGYQMIIWDDADLFSESPDTIADAWAYMEMISAYGNVGIYTTNYASSSTSSVTKSIYREWFGTDSGAVFTIDMDNREIYIFSDGKIYKTIDRSAALTITDNTYLYASAGDYAGCASEAMAEIATMLDGGHIATPMRILSALFLAMLVALMVTFIAAKWMNTASATPRNELIEGFRTHQTLENGRRFLVKRNATHHSSSGSGGSGGGGGGGGSSGGGGGHGF